jgi:predicted deacetylase
MSPRQDPLLRVLDAAPGPVTFFIRDDDAGWADERLHALLDVAADVNIPIDLAVIPEALQPPLAQALLQRMDQQPLGLHQHGWSHFNHEASGRKGEFGASRAAAQRLNDLRQGRDRLLQLLGPRVDAIFTPPWNRCADGTAEQLQALGFAALSRDAGATAQRVLPELPVHVDWARHCREATAAGDDLALRVASDLARQVPASAAPAAIGLMLHHAVMDDDELGLLRPLLASWTKHPRARWVPMRTLVRGALA